MNVHLRPILGWLGVAAVLTLPFCSLDGAVDMFLRLGTLKGESLDKAHKDEIDILAWSWGSSNSSTTHMGGGGGEGKASVQDLAVTKFVDRSSPEILLHAMNGKHIPDALLTVRKAGTPPLEYIKLELKDIIVTSVSTGGTGGEDRLTENVSLNFASFKLTYVPQSSTGVPLTPVTMSWNIVENVQGF